MKVFFLTNKQRYCKMHFNLKLVRIVLGARVAYEEKNSVITAETK